MADGILSKQMAGQRAFGVADAILRQLLPQKISSGKT
jgi:flagellar protein FlgJ